PNSAIACSVHETGRTVRPTTRPRLRFHWLIVLRIVAMSWTGTSPGAEISRCSASVGQATTGSIVVSSDSHPLGLRHRREPPLVRLEGPLQTRARVESDCEPGVDRPALGYQVGFVEHLNGGRSRSRCTGVRVPNSLKRLSLEFQHSPPRRLCYSSRHITIGARPT